MEYYSVRHGLKIILAQDLYDRFSLMMEDFALRDYFKQNLELDKNYLSPEVINRKSKGHIGVSIYPFGTWIIEQQKANIIFDSIEFLYRFVSKPGKMGYITDHTGYNTDDYLSYDVAEGRAELRAEVNILLKSFDQSYELHLDGEILFVGDESVNFIDVSFPAYDEKNIDYAIFLALKWWKNKNQSLENKKNAIIKLAGVLEYLKDDNSLQKILERKDTSDLFNIANNFGIRHHNLEQKTDYDLDVWYDWIFQYYLNTCIGVLKLIKKNKE